MQKENNQEQVTNIGKPKKGITNIVTSKSLYTFVCDSQTLYEHKGGAYDVLTLKEALPILNAKKKFERQGSNEPVTIEEEEG